MFQLVVNTGYRFEIEDRLESRSNQSEWAALDCTQTKHWRKDSASQDADPGKVLRDAKWTQCQRIRIQFFHRANWHRADLGARPGHTNLRESLRQSFTESEHDQRSSTENGSSILSPILLPKLLIDPSSVHRRLWQNLPEGITQYNASACRSRQFTYLTKGKSAWHVLQRLKRH